MSSSWLLLPVLLLLLLLCWTVYRPVVVLVYVKGADDNYSPQT
jgi:hypothetical protein